MPIKGAAPQIARWAQRRARVIVTGFVANDRSRSTIAAVVSNRSDARSSRSSRACKGNPAGSTARFRPGCSTNKPSMATSYKKRCARRTSRLLTLRGCGCAFDTVWQPVQESRTAVRDPHTVDGKRQAGIVFPGGQHFLREVLQPSSDRRPGPRPLTAHFGAARPRPPRTHPNPRLCPDCQSASGGGWVG